MTDPTPSSLAREKIAEQIAALDIAVDALRVLRDDGKIDRAFANFRIGRLTSRESDLINLRRTISLTSAVTDPPKPEQVADLRARVAALRALNVTAAAIEGIVREAALISGTVMEGGAESLAAPEAVLGGTTVKAAPLTLAFGAGAAAGLILAVLARPQK